MPHSFKNIYKLCFLWLLLLSISKPITAQNNLLALGSWREHYNNKSVQHIVKGNFLYGSTAHQVFSIDAKNNINFWGKSNGLHEIEIAAIAWDPTQTQLIIAYKNSNIDIVKGDKIYSIADIYLSNVYSDKKINSIQVLGPFALVATNFGIVVLDLAKYEIKDTWFANNTRQALVTYQTASTQDSLYAITEEGIYSTALKNNYISTTPWKKWNGYIDCNKIISYNNLTYAISNNNIYQLPQTNAIYTQSRGAIKNVNINNDGLYILSSDGKNGNLNKISTSGIKSTVLDSTFLSVPIDIAIDNNTIYIADSLNGLVINNTDTRNINLGGPNEKITGTCCINNQYLLAPFSNTTPGFSAYSESGWKNYSKLVDKSLPILSSAGIDPTDESWWFSSTNNLMHYNINNNSIETITPNNNPGNYTQLQFSKEGILWALQEGQGLVQKKDNKWSTIALPINFLKNGLKKMQLNLQGQVWIPAPMNQGLYVYQSNTYFTNDVWKQLTTAKSNGNLPSNNVLSVALDLTGAIWVGTDNGIGIFNCSDISKEVCDAYLPTIKNANGFIGFLLQRESVNCIAVDGANRKWVGTQNGAWLLNAEGTSIIEHFTKNNSPLPNDTILQILIEPTYGDVFFNTANEMVSYRGFATEGSSTQKNDIEIYPNPVPPSYNGPIAFRGLVENALVKITDISGSLIYETRALGGQALWNGKSFNGTKVATGIYLVFVRDEKGNEKTVGKILITKGAIQ